MDLRSVQVLERPKGKASKDVEATPVTKAPMHRRGSVKGRIYSPQNLQERLTARRQELGMSQEQVAVKITFWNNKQQVWKQLSRSAYCMYESGEVVPDLDKIMRLADVFHCTPQWLAFGTMEDNNIDNVEEVIYDEDAAGFTCKRFWDLDPEWVRSRFDTEPSEVALVMVNDFSPNFKPGDLAVVRKDAHPTVAGGEFVFVQDDEIRIAHVTRPHAGGGYRIYDTDLKHHEEVAPEALIFLGKVVGKMGDL